MIAALEKQLVRCFCCSTAAAAMIPIEILTNLSIKISIRHYRKSAALK